MKNSFFQRVLSGFVLAVIAFSSLLANPQPVQAGNVIMVNTWKDEKNIKNSFCSLREAVLSANKNQAIGGCTSGGSGTDVIVLPANLKDQYGITHNFEVTGDPEEDYADDGDLDIHEPVIISGAGTNKTVIASDGNDRVFHIISLGATVVTIQDLMITQGSGVDGGGGILNFASTLMLRNVYLNGNHANVIGGGGVRNHINILPEPDAVAYLWIYNSIIDANSTGGDGGGILNDGVMTINNSQISNNVATSGGGITSTLTYPSQVVNSTVTGNIGINGAGIYSAGALEIINSTITDNRGTGAVKGIVVQNLSKITLKNTIISGHSLPRLNCEIPLGATIISNGHNLADDDSCRLTSDPLEGVNPLLGSFDYHESEITQLFSLTSSSPAIDAGSNVDCPSTDQRGVHFGRPADGGSGTATCDIGAYEADALPAKLIYLPLLNR
jgi:CSLREA domain-containing protein